MGGLKISEPKIEIPKMPEGMKSFHPIEMPIFTVAPDGKVNGISKPTEELAPRIVPDLKLNIGVRYGGVGPVFLPEVVQVNSKAQAAVILTMMALGTFLRGPAALSWLASHFCSVFGMIAFPLLGMVKGDDKKEFPSNTIVRFEDERLFNEAVGNLQKMGGEPKTISWGGNFIHTLGTLDHGGEKIILDVVTSESFGDPAHPSPSSTYVLEIHSRGPLSVKSQFNFDSFITSIHTNITDPSLAERFHLDFVAEYQRTGSAKAAIEWLEGGPWRPYLLDLPAINEVLAAMKGFTTNEVIAAVPLIHDKEIIEKLISWISFFPLEERIDVYVKWFVPGLKRLNSIVEEILRKAAQVTRFENYDEFVNEQTREMEMKLAFEPRTISYEGSYPFSDSQDEKYYHAMETRGLVVRILSGETLVESFTVDISAESQFPIPLFRMKHYFLSASVGDRLFEREGFFSNSSEILLEFRTSSQQIAERVQQQFLDGYIQTGSAQKALKRVVAEPKGFEVLHVILSDEDE